MSFTVTDFHDLMRLLHEHPEWRAELRRLVLSDELLELPELVRQLAEAQRRSEERLTRLENAVAELTEAQRQLGVAFGQLQTAFGATVEDEAGSVLQSILEEKGYRLLAEPLPLVLDGEVDVVAPIETPDGHRAWALVEAKARLSRREVRDWAQRVRSGGWQKRLAEREVPGPYLVYAYGIRMDRGAVEEAERQGIGLLSGRGERVLPKGMIPSSAGG